MWTRKASQIRCAESKGTRAAETGQLRRISILKGQWGAVEEAVEHKEVPQRRVRLVVQNTTEESVGRRWEATAWESEAP